MDTIIRSRRIIRQSHRVNEDAPALLPHRFIVLFAFFLGIVVISVILSSLGAILSIVVSVFFLGFIVGLIALIVLPILRQVRFAFLIWKNSRRRHVTHVLELGVLSGIWTAIIAIVMVQMILLDLETVYSSLKPIFVSVFGQDSFVTRIFF